MTGILKWHNKKKDNTTMTVVSSVDETSYSEGKLGLIIMPQILQVLLQK